MGRSRKAGTKQSSQAFRKSQSKHDQEFDERQRIAERLVRALREAGYSCDLSDSGSARRLRRDN